MLRTTYLAYHKCYTLIMLHDSRGLSKLRNKPWLIDLYGQDNPSRCRFAPTPLYKDWLVVSLINQVDSTCASVMFSASYLVAGYVAPSIRWCCQTTFGPPRCCHSGKTGVNDFEWYQGDLMCLRA